MISSISSVRQINDWVRNIPKNLNSYRQGEEDSVGLSVTILDFLLFSVWKKK